MILMWCKDFIAAQPFSLNMRLACRVLTAIWKEYPFLAIDLALGSPGFVAEQKQVL